MPIVAALATSHAPSMFVPAEMWPKVHAGLVKAVPQPPEVAAETPAVLEDYVKRIGKAFGTLKSLLQAAEPDAVIIVGDDQNEVFSKAQVPAYAIFLGEQASGTTSIGWIGQKHEDNHITLKSNPKLARAITERLIKRGFDVSYIEELKPLGRPAGGLGHAFTRIGKVLGLHERGIPTIPLFVNACHPPLPTAARCLALGKTLADMFASRPERIVIVASGGLSHCPGGPRAGWVDEPLDRWVLQRIEDGETEELANLFTFDSDTLRSGTGEIRCWIVAAGAFSGRPGKVIDYIPARHAVTGLGFAHWN
jgi:protocatechuate 4,5-dioxygenase beta chain